MATIFVEKRKFIISFILYIYITSVRGTTTITTSCIGLVSEPFNITCTIDPHNSISGITLPDGTDAAACSAPVPNTICTQIPPYKTDYSKVGTNITLVLTIPSLDIGTHNGTWTCNHGSETSTGNVCVNAPLSLQGKEPIFTASSTSAKSISLNGEAYCQHPVSAVTFEVLYAEQNGAYTTFNPQPFISIQNLGSNGCGSHESNVSFSGILSCDNYTLAGKTFTLMARFNQSNLPPDSHTYNITSSGSFSCPDAETTTITNVETTTTMNPPDKGLSTGGVIGIVIGVLIFIIIVVVVVVCICKHIKKGSVDDKTSLSMIPESSVITNTQAQQPWPRKLPSIEPKSPTKVRKGKQNKVKPKPTDDKNHDQTKKPKKKSETHQMTQNDNNHDQTEKTKGKSSEKHQPTQNDNNHDKTENTHGKSETHQPPQNDNNHDKTEKTKGKSETNQPTQNDNNQHKTENTKEKSETNQPIQNDNNHDKTENTKNKN